MSIHRHLAFRTTAELLSKGGSVLLMVVAARVLGRETFGEFSLAWTTGWLVATASDVGLHLTALREVVRGEIPATRVAGSALVAKLLLTVAALGLLASVAPWLGVHDRVALWAIAGSLVAMSYVDLGQHLLRAAGAFRADALAQVGARGALVAGGLVGLAANGMRGMGYGLLAGGLAGLAGATIATTRRVAVVPSAADVGWMLRRALPVGAGITLSIAYFRVDLFLVDALAGTAAVGLYASAYRVFESAQLLPAVAMTVLFPRLAATEGEAEGKRLRSRARAALAGVGAGVGLAGVILAPLAVRLLYGEQYHAAAAPLAVLFCAAPLAFTNYLLTQDLVASGRQTRFALVAAAALAFNVAANLALVPRYGALAASGVTVGTEAVVLAGCALALWGDRLAAARGRWESVACTLAAAALASLPFESDRLAVVAAGVRVTLPEALVFAAVAATTVALAGRPVREWLPDRALLVAGLTFLAALAVSSALAPDERANAIKFSLRMAAGLGFCLAVAALVARRPARAAVLLGAYLAGVAVSSALGVVEALAPERVDALLSLFREAPIYAAGIRRATSTYGYPNTLAAAIATALPAAAALAAVRTRATRVLASAAAATAAVALVATYSRGGAVAAVVGLATLAAVGRQRLAVASSLVAITIAVGWAAAAFGGAALARRGVSSSETGLLSARVEPATATLAVAPGAASSQPVRVTNTGSLAWRSTPDAPFVLASRWYAEDGRAIEVEGPRTSLPEVVAPGASVVADAAFAAPDVPGRYTLAWDVYVEHRLRFSERGVPTGDVAVAVGDVEPAPALAPPAGRPPPEDIYVSPPRSDLWRAALAMFAERPLVGFGPDSYRLSYGRYLGLAKWDHRVFANDLALELLATTGVVGFAAFACVVAVAIARSAAIVGAARAGTLGPLAAAAGLAAVAALAATLAHGVVDYFLEFTSGYVAFWTFVGLAAGLAAAARRPEGAAE